jgi:hypothetical protein
VNVDIELAGNRFTRKALEAAVMNLRVGPYNADQ